MLKEQSGFLSQVAVKIPDVLIDILEFAFQVIDSVGKVVFNIVDSIKEICSEAINLLR